MALNKIKAISIISSKGGKKDMELSNKYNMDVYLLNDSSIIACEFDYYVAFNNIKEFNSFLSKYRPTA